MHGKISKRDLVRRWYGQIQKQPDYVVADLYNCGLMAHTVIPEHNRSAFSECQFAPMSGVIDLVLSVELNSANLPTGLLLQGFRSSYDIDTNTVQIGGAANLRFQRDLRLRPFVGSHGRYIDPNKDAGVLLAGLDMEAECEATMRRPHLLRLPRFTNVLLSFTEENAPKFAPTEGIKRVALTSLMPGAEALPSMCVRNDFSGIVTKIHEDRAQQVTLVELENEDCYEVPACFRLLVSAVGEQVNPGQPIAKYTLPHKILRPIRQANHTVETLWDAVVDNIGQHNARFILREVWDSYVFKWAGMTMASHHLLDPAMVKGKLTAVWRDLSCSLNRTCHDYRKPGAVVRKSPHEGNIAVWSRLKQEQPGHFDIPGGSADLIIKTAHSV